MAIGVILFIAVVAIFVIWLLVEFKRARHKFFAIFMIALILFSYFSFTYVAKKNDVDLSSVPGIIGGGKVYLSWLGSLFGNVKAISGYAVNMDWKSSNETKSKK
ncbi:MAG TPA: hypothetical protein VJH92_00780 [Candidatus Nanoarchaeia archaeon]|nr:hypothetical protein [Candidatus Nanoarchaeia archaeon]